MNIAITFRQMEASDAMKVHATEKVSKLQKFLRDPIKAHVTMSCENNRSHCVEVDLKSGAEHFHAHVVSDDMHASLDQVIDKLEAQIREAKSTVHSQRKGAERASQRLLEDVGED